MLYPIICEQCGKQSEKHHKTARFCSVECQNIWQRTTPWDERIDKKRAEEIRKERSIQVGGDNNPSKRKDVAKKISNSLKKYLSENPRVGELNPFYGHHHTEEFKKNHRESKKGKWAYNEEQYKKLCKNTPRGDKHSNWNGGSSIIPYTVDFNKILKKAVKKLYKNKCAICLKDVKLCVHHIDYNKANSDLNNLVALCVSCHFKTNNNRESWTKFFKELKEQEKNKHE